MPLLRWNRAGPQMSYCRFVEADAYIYLGANGLECCGCWLAPREKLATPYTDMFGIVHEYTRAYVPPFDTARQMLEHIADHRGAGHYIPESVDEALKEDYPDLDESTAETEEERLEREERMRPANERIKAKMRQSYFESFTE